MLAFIIPLKPKSQSKNWENDCLLLQQTIASISNQECKKFKIYLVFSDKPEIVLDAFDIEYISFPYSFPSLSDIPNATSIMPHFNNDSVMLLRRWIKAGKFFMDAKKQKKRVVVISCQSIQTIFYPAASVVIFQKTQMIRICPAFILRKGIYLKMDPAL